jgi:hypothetical protein
MQRTEGRHEISHRTHPTVALLMKIFWLKSRKWKRDDLDGKLVEFRITYADVVVEGIGKFLMRGTGVEMLAADIVVSHPQEFYDNYCHVPDSLFERIEPHPDQTKAAFRLIGRFDPGSGTPEPL